jgi:D-sedoheptulose 7-phosphate isomerase
MNIQEEIAGQFEESRKVLEEFISDTRSFSAIAGAAELMTEAMSRGNKIISCGNGGSMCDAMHFAEELTGRFRNNRKSLAAISISDPSFLSCVANDYGYDFVFSRFVEGMGQKGDVLLAISTSGNSENVLKAIESDKEKVMKVIGLTGKDGGKMAKICDVEIRAPHSVYADRAQEIHIKVIHNFIYLIEKGLGLA